jgi:hypothetical protein
MRENRTSGSEGGETGRPVFPTPIEASTTFFNGLLTAVPRVTHDTVDPKWSRRVDVALCDTSKRFKLSG